MGKRKRSVLDEYVERHFVTNEYGAWCPNCQEAIDMMWPDSCDHCGWPKRDYERYDEDGYFDDYHPGDMGAAPPTLTEGN